MIAERLQTNGAWRWELPALVAVSAVFGLLVSLDDLLLPLALLGVIAVVIATQLDDLVLASILLLAALLGLPVAGIAGVAEIRLIEFATPFVLLVLGLSSVTRPRPGTADRMRRGFAESGARLVNVGVLLFGVAVALNLFRSKYLQEATTSGTARTFYDYLVALGIYIAVYTLLKGAREKSLMKLVRFLYWFSAAACVIGVIAVALELPLDLGSLRYSVFNYESGAVRVGFLETFGILGLSIALAVNVRFRLAGGCLFAAALVASGGRAATVGMAVAAILYYVATQRSWRVMALSVAAALVLALAPQVLSNAQVERISDINRSALAENERLFLYEESLRQFADHPVVGTGVGVPSNVSNANPDRAEFYNSELETGGHATYTSLLKNFGLVGFLPFVFALLYAVAKLWRRTRDDALAAFFFLFLIAEAIGMVAGSNGSDPVFFFALAGSAAMLVRTAPTSSAGELGPAAQHVAESR